MDKTKASDFCLQNQEDKKVCLTDYKGKWVILYFYPKDNSKTCTLEADTLSNTPANFTL
ncbi:MAG: redoxin domain-containing protein [archaeon]